MKFIGELLSFRGRIGRGEFITIIICDLVGLIVAIGASSAIAAPMKSARATETIFTVVIALLIVLAKWISLAAVAKRFHDIDWSGAACLLVFVPLIGAAVYIAMAIAGGTDGPNRFGQPRGYFGRAEGKPAPAPRRHDREYRRNDIPRTQDAAGG